MNKVKSTAKHIAIYCSSDAFGGLEMNIVRLASWLAMDGYKVTMLLPNDTPVANYAITNGLSVVYVEINRKYFDLRRARRLAFILKEHDVDFLVVSATRDVDLGSVTKRFFCHRLRLIYFSQMQVGVPKRGWLHTLRYRMYDKWLVALPYLKAEIGRLTRFPIDRVEVVPLCVDTTFLTSFMGSKPNARKQFGLPENDLVLGVLGRIDPMKRQDFLIQAIHRLNALGHCLHLLIVGEPTRNDPGNYMEKIQCMVDELKLQDQVHFAPFMDDTRGFFKAIDIFAMSTSGETFGMVTVEAMVSGVPVIASHSGGSIELLEHGQTGSLYQPDHIDSFVAEMVDLTSRRDGLEEFAAKVQKNAILKYDKAIVINAFRQLIQQLAI